MGTKISGICGTEGRGTGEITLNNATPIPEETTKAKSASTIQQEWKRTKTIKSESKAKLQEIKECLDEKSRRDDEFVSIEDMNSKISPNVIETENNLPPFIRMPEINNFDMTFQRDPILLKDGAIYYGSWNEKGQRHGYGILIRNDGSKYEGFFFEDNIQGRGRYIEKEGMFYYEGMWKDNKAHEQGYYVLSDGTKYTGQWKDDIQEGEGEEILPDGTVYKGQFKDGEKNGYGLVKWTDGSTYEGEIVNGVIHGKGIYRWSDGRVYDGQWLMGKMHGKGKFSWPDGKYYEGEYKNDKKDGYGKYFCGDRCYEGTWFSGKQNGYGSILVQNEPIMKAFWRYGKIIRRDFEKKEKENFDALSLGTNGIGETKQISNGETKAIEQNDAQDEKSNSPPAVNIKEEQVNNEVHESPHTGTAHPA